MVVVPAGAAVVMPGHIRALGHNDGRNRQPRRMIVLIPLGNPFDGENKEHSDHKDKCKGKHDSEQDKAKTIYHILSSLCPVLCLYFI